MSNAKVEMNLQQLIFIGTGSLPFEVVRIFLRLNLIHYVD